MGRIEKAYKSKISRALVVYVLLFSSAITLVLTALQLHKDYRYDLSLIDKRLAQIEISILGSLAQNMWTLNNSAIRLQLEGLLRLPDIVYLEVSGPGGQLLASAGAPDTGDIVSRSYPVEYGYRGVPRQLGTLRAIATLDNVYQRLIDTFVAILVTQGIKTFLVSAFIIFIVTRLITRHLGHLSEHFQRLDPRYPTRLLELERKPGPMSEGDELDQLVRAYNDMQHNARESYSELAYNESMLERAQQIAHIGSWEIKPEGGPVCWSNEVWQIVQCADLGRGDGFEGYIHCAHADDRTVLRRGLRKIVETGEPLFMEHRVVCENGVEKTVEFRAQYYVDQQNEDKRLIGTVHDVSEHCKQRMALQHMANFDSLTGLPNRWLLNSRLEMAVAESNDKETCLMLALMDLDGFKEVNDSLGHQTGDELLRQKKPRLEGLLPEGDTLARLGGDEFAILLNGLSSAAEGIERVGAIIEAMGRPFDLNLLEVQIGVSIGISLFPDHAADGSTLLRYADVAMYYAKRNKLHHTIYSPEIDPHTPRRLELISDMGRAIREQQLVLHYQPKVRAADGVLDSVEALVRWQHPVHGFITPDEFIPLCEISDIIRPLTLWVLRKALADCARWHASGFEIGVSVNVSVRNVLDSRFPEEVIDLLADYPIRSELLTLEITESALMEDPARAKLNIDRLHSAGVNISTDDFGTGYSSLSYLKHIPVQELKIDRGFVFDMLEDENDGVIVRSTVDLAHSLGITVTAEGVENAAIMAALRVIKCDCVQGYHIAKPMPYDALSTWLEGRPDIPLGPHDAEPWGETAS